MLHHRLRAAAGNKGGGGGIPQSGLLIHYTMDNISGSTLIDESVNGNDGNIVGPTIETGYLDFDGTNDRVDVTGFDVKRQSLAYFADITPDVIGENDSVVDDINGFGAAFFRFQSGSIYFYIWNGSTYRTLIHPVTAGNRYKIVAQHDSVDGSELWVNGVLVDSDLTPWTVVYAGSESGRRLGATYALQTGRFYDGKFWEFAEYNRLLTSTEISEHFS